MKFNFYTLENCASATGLVVVIDVLRAFSTAAFAFAAGVNDIYLVSEVDEAFVLRDNIINSKIMGEVNGIKVDGFDYGNSPTQFDDVDLSGLTLIQRTTSGTQGVVKSINATKLLTASFCNAGTTADYISREAGGEVSFIITGQRQDWGDEDLACAEYIRSRVYTIDVDSRPFLERVRNSIPGRFFQDPGMPQYPKEDLEYCLELDKFSFFMEAERSGKHLRLRASTL